MTVHRSFPTVDETRRVTEKAAIDLVQLPRRERAPLTAVLRRVAFAGGLVVFVALVVLLGRSGYVDAADGHINFLDALYYASVTVTTTGYGDITAVSDGARLAAILLITPARVLFLILVVGTTVEVLTDQSRQHMLTRRWRQRVKDHYVICGFGATGQAAAAELVSRGVAKESIVAVDLDAEAVAEATREGIVGIHGDATQNAVLQQAAIADAKAVVVTPNRDDTAVLVTLTARELSPNAHIAASGRAQENLHLLRQGGADEVIDATSAVGRMLGLATHAPGAVELVDDLIDASSGLEIVAVAPTDSEGRATAPRGATLVAVIRAGTRLTPDELESDELRMTDRLIVVRDSERPDRV